MGRLTNAERQATAAAHAAGELSAAEAACSPAERQFVYWYVLLPINGGSQAEAARRAGFGASSTPTVLNGIVQALLRKPRIIDLIREVSRKHLGALAPHAPAAFAKILKAGPDHKDYYKVAANLAERIEPTVVRNDINVRVEMVDHDKEAVAYLRKLLALGVSREKIEAELGYSDLPRYERLLQLEDASKSTSRVIDAEYTEAAE